jgi:hypothetical protein
VANDEDDDLDVKAVLADFKLGVGAEVSDEDVAVHFDLGIAYQEMGLLADAAAEFELVVRAEPTHAGATVRLIDVHASMGNPRPGTPEGEA